MLFIYMPIIRNEVNEFVDLWNVHKIRKQRERLNLPTRKPMVNYLCPAEGVRDYGVIPDLERLQRFNKDVEEYDRLDK
jgi:hypothetical protein